MPWAAIVGAAVLQHLETFSAVAEFGSLTRAAEHLNLTQPAVTRQLRALERELGAVLVTRTPHGVALTSVGQAVLPHAREALAAARACQQAASEASSRQTQGLRVAAGMMATQYVLPPVVATFKRLHPELEVELQPAHQRVALERLLGYEVDAAVIATRVRSPQVRALPILHDPLLMVGGPGQPDEPVALEQLNGKTLLVLPQGTGLHEQIVSALHERHIHCHLVEYPTAETIKTAVALGMGSAILPESAVSAELRLGTLSARPIASWDGAERVIQVLVRSEGRPPAAVAELIRLLREHYSADG